MLKRVLIALDSFKQTAVVDWVLQFKLTPETQAILCHVIVLSESNLERPADLPSVEADLDQFRHIERELRSYQALLPCPSDIEIVTGDPAEEILRLARIHAADLIVLGSRGLTGVNRILSGSVSSQVVSEAPCTVLVVRLV